MFSFHKKNPPPVETVHAGSQDSDDELEQTSTSRTRFLDQPRLHNAGEHVKEALSGRNDPEKRRRWRPIAVGGALVLLLGLISLFKAYHGVADHDVCGPTPDAARAKGCVFDVLTFCWVKPECDDPELTKEFLGVQPWKYYAQMNGTEEVSLEEAAKGDRQLYVTWEYHLVHCAYCYKKVHRAILGNGYIDSHLGSYNHTSHCAKMSNMEIPYDEVTVIAPLHFTSCNSVKYDVDKRGI